MGFFLIWAPISVGISFKRDKEKFAISLNFVILLQFITVIATIPVILLALNQGTGDVMSALPHGDFFSSPAKYFDQLHYVPCRYLINFFIGPITIGQSLLLYKHFKQPLNYFLARHTTYIILLFSMVIVFSLVLTDRHHYQDINIFKSSPALVKCLDFYAKQYHLTNGISPSYRTTLTNAFTTQKLHIALVTVNTLKPTPWQTTKQIYHYYSYNFAVFNTNQTKVVLEKRFGMPQHQFICKGRALGNYTLFIYSKNQLNHIFDK